MCPCRAFFVKPLSRLLRDPLQPASRPSSDVQADNTVFCCRAALRRLQRLQGHFVTVTPRNRTGIIVPHPDLLASLLALKAGLPARLAAGSRHLPAAYGCHASCSMAAAILPLRF